MEILLTILRVLWFLAPAGAANIAPPFFRRVKWLHIPVDGGRTWKGRRLLGRNKTIKGFVVGVSASILAAGIQHLLYPYIGSIAIVDYTQYNFVLIGFLFGFGALFGDAVESFFKRRLKIPSGKPFVPFDQIDWIIGGLVFVGLYVPIPWMKALLGVLVYGILHPVLSYLGYKLGIKKDPF